MPQQDKWDIKILIPNQKKTIRNVELSQPKYQTLKSLFDAVNEELNKNVAAFPKELIPLETCRNN